jgi:hypothetical protein
MQPNAITHLDKYIEIKNLSNPQKAFERLENQFIDIMYPDRLSADGVVMLLDLGIDPKIEKELVWLKGLLDTVLLKIGETAYFLTPFNPEQIKD